MPTVTIEIKKNQAFLESNVSPVGVPEKSQNYLALLDTGAQATLISQRIVEELGLEPIGLAPIRTVGGQQIQVDEYRMSLAIPVLIGPNAIFGLGRDMNVLLLPYQPGSHDVLLGMNFLTNFHITMHRNQILVSI